MNAFKSYKLLIFFLLTANISYSQISADLIGGFNLSNNKLNIEQIRTITIQIDRDIENWSQFFPCRNTHDITASQAL